MARNMAHTLQEVYSFSRNAGGGAGGSLLVIMTVAVVWAVLLVLLFMGRMPRTGACI